MTLEKAKEFSLQEVTQWGEFAKKSGIVPPDMTKEQAMAIIQTGREMGIGPMQALRAINFIKGRMVTSVQMQLALAIEKGVSVVKRTPDEEIDKTGVCEVTLRRGDTTQTCRYSLEDARKAGLIRPQGNWDKHTRQMLRWRAIGDALRMIAPDTVMGLMSPEEAEAEAPLLDTPKDVAAKTDAKAEVLTRKLEEVKRGPDLTAIGKEIDKRRLENLLGEEPPEAPAETKEGIEEFIPSPGQLLSRIQALTSELKVARPSVLFESFALYEWRKRAATPEETGPERQMEYFRFLEDCKAGKRGFQWNDKKAKYEILEGDLFKK